jgi:lysophospholipase L1-like esterase
VQISGAGNPVLVVLGDSITDGVGSTADLNRRWTDALAERFAKSGDDARWAVVNAGVAGNRLLHDAADPYVGPSALNRFDRDALDQPGVRALLLLHGINDITANAVLESPTQVATPEKITEGMKTLIARAHDKGVKVLGGTLLPLDGVGAPFYSVQIEQDRQKVNEWIRSSHAFDAVIDFDAAMREPEHPTRLRPEFDSGDHLHPNDAGYKAMADLIDLRSFDAFLPRH